MMEGFVKYIVLVRMLSQSRVRWKVTGGWWLNIMVEYIQ